MHHSWFCALLYASGCNAACLPAGTNAHTQSVLDGIHMGLGRHALLPAAAGYKKEANFNKETFICMLDWGTTSAYTFTLGILVLGPSVISIVYNYYYIFSMKRRLNSGAPIHDKEYATALAENLANPSHWMSFLLVMAFWLSWAPYAGVRLYEWMIEKELQIPMLHFGVVWLGILNSFWKIVILISLSPQFRLALRILCLTACCRTKGRLQAELIGLDNDD